MQPAPIAEGRSMPKPKPPHEPLPKGGYVTEMARTEAHVIRSYNLLCLARDRFDGDDARFRAALGVVPAFPDATRDTPPSPFCTLNVKADFARTIESRLGLPNGSLDQHPTHPTVAAPPTAPALPPNDTETLRAVAALIDALVEQRVEQRRAAGAVAAADDDATPPSPAAVPSLPGRQRRQRQHPDAMLRADGATHATHAKPQQPQPDPVSDPISDLTDYLVKLAVEHVYGKHALGDDPTPTPKLTPPRARRKKPTA